MTASTHETVELLGHVPVFAPLAANDLELVAEVCHPRRFGAGEVVFREGDESNTCYVVRSGHARAVREHADGRQIALATFGPGDIFGELAMFDDERRSATVETIDALEVLAILGPDMRRLMLRRPQIAVSLAASLSRRLRTTNERLASQSFQTVQSRVASVIAQLVDQARAEGADGARRADHRHPGRPGDARGLLARVRFAVPGDARTGRRDLTGAWPAHGPRPGGAAQLCLLSWRPPTAVSSSEATSCSSSRRPARR